MKLAKRIVSSVIITSLFLSMLFPFGISPFTASPAEAAGNYCSAARNTSYNQGRHYARVGGASLNQAANYIALLDDITGAYYDSTLKRIVLIGKSGSAAPEYGQDDLAVAIRAIIFNGTLPDTGLEFGTPSDDLMDVTYSGGVQNTHMGRVMIDTDVAFKELSMGYDADSNTVSSSVSGYSSLLNRIVAKGNVYNANNATRIGITPKDVIIRRDTSSNSFIFDTFTMGVSVDHINPSNETGWNEAYEEFATQFTNNYEAYADETEIFEEVKQLAKIVALVKWIKDNNIPTDFNWAQNYTPTYVATPTQVDQITTPSTGPNSNYITGEVNFDTANTYQTDTGDAAALKTAAQNVGTSKEDIHWTFTKDSIDYEAVAITADAFESIGSYDSVSTDMAFPTAGDVDLAFQRSYSTFSYSQQGLGRGWTMFPAALYNNKPTAALFTCMSGDYPKSLAFVTQTGQFESFTINDCNVGYVPDDDAYNSSLVKNGNGTFTVTTPDQTAYTFNQYYKLATVADTNDNTITYEYDASGSGKLVGISDDASHEITINYTGDLISSIEDWAGREVIYTYDTNDTLLSVTDVNGNTRSYTYDTNDRLTTITDRNNDLILTNTYNPDDRINTTKDASNVTRTYAYDNDNREITVSDDQIASRTATLSYDVKGRILEEEDALGNSVTYTYDDEYKPLTVTDKRNNTITNTYDTDGNLTSVTYPDTKVVEYTYDSGNRVTEISDGRYGVSPKVTEFTYDGNGNLTEIDEDGTVTGFTYNGDGEVLTVTDPRSKVTTFTRNTFGDVATVTDEYNKVTNYTYDILGRLSNVTDANAKLTGLTYDDIGNVLTASNAAGTTTYQYDDENQLVNTIYPDATEKAYTYNAAGSITEVTDQLDNDTDYGYDAYQNLLTQQNALLKTTTMKYDKLNQATSSATPLNKISKWQYDANGNVVSRIDPKNDETEYTYDAFNRLTLITYPDTSTVEYTYDNRGNVVEMVDSVGTSTYTYDSLDRLTEYTDANENTVGYDYDDAGNITMITYPDNKEVDYVYDDNNRLATVTDWNNKTTTYTYNDNGTLATISYPSTFSGKYIKTFYTYDNANRLVDITHKEGTSVKARYQLTRNSLGNITIATESGAWNSGSKDFQYTYDNLNRVTGVNASTGDDFVYTYDDNGNMLTKQIVGDPVTSYTYNDDDQLIVSTYDGDDTDYTYDNNGNLIEKDPDHFFDPTSEYFYNYENKLISFKYDGTEEIEYTYDGNGMRMTKEIPGDPIIKEIYDITKELPMLIALNEGSGSLDGWFVHGLGPISTGDASSSRAYIHQDYTGSTRHQTFESSTAEVGDHDYEPYGYSSISPSLIDPIFRFQGQRTDSSTLVVNNSLYYMNARYYDAETGRFISRDPFAGYISDPRSQNSYSYAYNNPLIYSDPSGLDAMVYTDPLASIPFIGGHTGLYYQNGQGSWYKSDLSVAPNQDPIDGKGNYNIQELSSDFNPSSVSKVWGIINNPLVQYIETTQEQDIFISNFVSTKANRINSGSENYKLFNNNCKTSTYDALQGAGVFAPDSNYQPSPMIRWGVYNRYGF